MACPNCNSESLVRGERQGPLGEWIEYIACQHCGWDEETGEEGEE